MSPGTNKCAHSGANRGMDRRENLRWGRRSEEDYLSPLATVFYLLGPSDAKWTDTIARPTGFDAGLVELVLPAATIAQAAQAHGQADDISVATIQCRTP